MSRRTFAVSEKKAIALGWARARSQGMSQEAYAADHGTTARRVREFVNEYAPACSPARVLAVIDDAIEQLQRMRAWIGDEGIVEAEPARLPAVVVADHVDAVVSAPPGGTPAHVPPAPTPTRSKFQWTMEEVADD